MSAKRVKLRRMSQGSSNKPLYGEAEVSSVGVWIKHPETFSGSPATLGPSFTPWSMVVSVEHE